MAIIKIYFRIAYCHLLLKTTGIGIPSILYLTEMLDVGTAYPQYMGGRFLYCFRYNHVANLHNNHQ